MDPARARFIPSIDRLRRLPRARALDAAFGPDAVLDALRAETAALRAELQPAPDAGHTTSIATTEDPAAPRADATGPAAPPDSADAATARILDGAEARLAALFRSRLRATINATGVIIHTNLGRAPLSPSALARIVEIGAAYSSLEYDLTQGVRGRRDVHAEPLLCHLTAAGAAIVVNNNAAAVLLLLSALAMGREVIISRGELVEIGGGFRIPDVMRQSGAILREVGTTNKTRSADYAAAISERTALILRVHPSNFVMQGFTARPRLDELSAIARQFNIPLAEDLGSGYLHASIPSAPHTAMASRAAPSPDSSNAMSLDATPDATMTAATLDEPSVQASLRAGVDVVTFSGDKLFGGPQAGVIAGRRDLVDTMRHHPLMRALRVDKLTYAALEATLVEHVSGRASATVPVLRMLSMSQEEIGRRADALARGLTEASSPAAEDANADVQAGGESRAAHAPSGVGARLRTAIVDGFSAVGGGSAPGTRLPTRLLAIDVPGLSADALLARLRAHDPPIVARIDADRVVLDLRTVLPEQELTLRDALLSLS